MRKQVLGYDFNTVAYADQVFTTKSDIFPLGCIFYYVLSMGGHPYGEMPKQDSNILEGKLVCLHEPDPIKYFPVIGQMLSDEQDARPDCNEILLTKFRFNEQVMTSSQAISTSPPEER